RMGVDLPAAADHHIDAVHVHVLDLARVTGPGRDRMNIGDAQLLFLLVLGQVALPAHRPDRGKSTVTRPASNVPSDGPGPFPLALSGRAWPECEGPCARGSSRGAARRPQSRP